MRDSSLFRDSALRAETLGRGRSSFRDSALRAETLGRGRWALLAVAVLLGGVLVWTPDVAQACAVCFQAKSDASRVAFIATTAGLTFLPLIVIGGVAWWVRRQFVKADQARSEV